MDDRQPKHGCSPRPGRSGRLDSCRSRWRTRASIRGSRSYLPRKPPNAVIAHEGCTPERDRRRRRHGQEQASGLLDQRYAVAPRSAKACPAFQAPGNCQSHARAAKGGRPPPLASAGALGGLDKGDRRRTGRDERATKEAEASRPTSHTLPAPYRTGVRVHMPAGKRPRRSSGQPVSSSADCRTPWITSAVSRWLTSTIESRRVAERRTSASDCEAHLPPGPPRRSHSSGPSHRAATPPGCAEAHALLQQGHTENFPSVRRGRQFPQHGICQIIGTDRAPASRATRSGRRRGMAFPLTRSASGRGSIKQRSDRIVEFRFRDACGNDPMGIWIVGRLAVAARARLAEER